MRLPVAAARVVQTLRHRHVGGKALQAADLDRLALGGLAHAGLFAQGFGGADAGADAAKDILAPDRLCGGFGRAGPDLADEKRDVDRVGQAVMQGASWQK